MSELDTSAYSPAQQQEEQEDERTRFQIPADTSQIENLEKTVENLKQKVRTGTEFSEQIQELEQLLEQYDARKFLKMYVYKCSRCEETFDTKKALGVHQAQNPNCSNENNRPWNIEPAEHVKIRVEDL